MFIRNFSRCEEITAGDNALLKQFFNPLNDPLDLRYSLAISRVKPGETTYLHRLKSSEVYYIISGEGELRIDSENEQVHPGQAIYIPPHSTQQIKCTGKEELVFLCIVDPPWREEDEEILPENTG